MFFPTCFLFVFFCKIFVLKATLAGVTMSIRIWILDWDGKKDPKENNKETNATQTVHIRETNDLSVFAE